MLAEKVRKPSLTARFLDSDIGWSFRRTPAAWLSALMLALLILTALLCR